MIEAPPADQFPATEGDRWLARNLAKLGEFELAHDEVFSLVQRIVERPASVLEVGCSIGHRLNALAAQWGVRAVGVDVSPAAVAEGRRRFPNVTFRQGRITAIPTAERFDLVIVNFVLHWVERDGLFRALAEIDRSVAVGGHLVIGDFLPDEPTRVAYHHLSGLWTYKTDYPQIFVDTGLYRATARHEGSHAAIPSGGIIPSSERTVHALLKKVSTDGYPLTASTTSS